MPFTSEIKDYEGGSLPLLGITPNKAHYGGGNTILETESTRKFKHGL